VVRRYSHFSGSIHLCHLSQKIQAMIWSALQHIELPLMDHFMSQGIEQLLFRVWRPCGELFKQRERKANFAMTASHGERIEGLWPLATGKHPNRGGQALTPDDLDRLE
jgi:hypothetical protein